MKHRRKKTKKNINVFRYLEVPLYESFFTYLDKENEGLSNEYKRFEIQALTHTFRTTTRWSCQVVKNHFSSVLFFIDHPFSLKIKNKHRIHVQLEKLTRVGCIRGFWYPNWWFYWTCPRFGSRIIQLILYFQPLSLIMYLFCQYEYTVL